MTPSRPGEQTVAAFLESRRWLGAISRERSFGCASHFFRWTGRYSTRSSRWAADGVRRQSARKRRWGSRPKAAIGAAWVYAIDLACEVPFFAMFYPL